MLDYFQLLGVNFDSSSKEIKIAYVKKIREFPPEKDAEKYNEIREAFETLIDEEKRTEYIAFVKYGQEINELDKAGTEALEDKNYEKAIGHYKKILLIEPSLSFAQNKLALAFFYNKQFEDGIAIMQKLVEKYPNEACYLGNIAYGYKEAGAFEKAEEFCLNALRLDPYNHGNLSLLIGIYIEKRKIGEALDYLKIGMEKYKSLDFREFIYFYEFLKVSSYCENSSNLTEGLRLLENIISNNEELKDFILWKLSELADELYKNCDFTDSSILLECLLKYNENMIYDNKLYTETRKLSMISKKLDELLKDERVAEVFKKTIFLYCIRFRMVYREFEKQILQQSIELEEFKRNMHSQFVQNIEILKNEYKELYDLKKWYFKRFE